MSERTFSISKPDAVAAKQTGAIIQMILDAGLSVKAMKMIRLTREQAEGFYAVHSARPFFKIL
jgi:nucleoside-diphosphate kinase